MGIIYMSSTVKTTLKKVSSSDSIFSNDSDYQYDDIYNALVMCKNFKKGDEMIPLISQLKTSIEETEDKSFFEIDFFYQFSNLMSLFSKKDRKIMPYLEDVGKTFIRNMNEWVIPDVIDTLILCSNTCDFNGEPVRNTRKEYSLKLLSLIVELYPNHIKNKLVDLIDPVSSLSSDLGKDINAAANILLDQIIKCNGNSDLDPFLPSVNKFFKGDIGIEVIIDELAGCVFVQDVELPALSLIEPILNSALKYNKSEIQRKACVILDNMCKLIEKPEEIVPIALRIKPLLVRCTDTISNPEAREMSERALVTLNKTISKGETIDGKLLVKTKEDIINLFKEKISGQITIDESSSNEYILKCFDYNCIVIKNLSNSKNFDYQIWEKSFEKFLQFTEAKELLKVIYDECKVVFDKKENVFEDTEEGADLYKGEFSLAYGSLTLLNNTKIHLKRNRFYGLLGPNNCGKTTLMRAIANEQVEGFPKKDELKTIFVEHEIQEREVGEDDKGYPIFNIDLCGIDWVVDCCNEIYKMDPPVKREDVERVMEEIGFGNSKNDSGKDRAADAAMAVTTYSGGWKMKMQLCAATLMNADILMLDEPTGHLDVDNIAWLKSWLTNFKEKGGSIITTSHDSAFLDAMCTHIIDFENRKLRMFRGDNGTVLKQFVEKHPEKQGYFELKNDIMKFEFPTPLPLGKGSKCILKMTNVSYKYPIRDNYTVMDISLNCSTSSRVAVIGPNGAGKSIAIKLLIGELKPSKGVIWKNPNSRVAYVAQHAFHHLEKHISKTPTEYILWRFAGNDDKESLEFKPEENDNDAPKRKYFLKPAEIGYEIRQCSNPAEEKLAVYPDYLMGRRLLKKEKTKEYEVKWKNKPREQTTWVKREILVSMGALQKVQKYDEKKAAEEGLMTKSLTSKHIEK